MKRTIISIVVVTVLFAATFFYASIPAQALSDIPDRLLPVGLEGAVPV